MLIIGHRGAAGYEPENTLRSFKRAIDMKADMIEMDLYTCKTGEPVIIHDYTVDRTTNGTGYIWDLTFKELRSLNAGKGEKIPALEEVMGLADKKIALNLELKGGNTAVPAAKVINKYVEEKGWEYKNLYISSFNHPLLQEFISLVPANSGIRICPLTYGIPLNLAGFAAELSSYSVNISADFVNRDIVNDAHKNGMKVFVYVVNNMEELSRMRSFCIDGIFTDYPDILEWK